MLYDELYNMSLNISKMGCVEGRAAVQAWEVEVSLFLFFPPAAHGLTSNFLFVQLLFCFPSEVGLFVSLACFGFHAFNMCFYIEGLKVCMCICTYI